MQNKSVKYLAGIVLGCIAIAIYFGLQQVQQQHNGFNRKLIKTGIATITNVDLKDKSCYVAGFTSDKLLLGNYAYSGEIIELSLDLMHMKCLHYDIPANTKFAWGAAKFQYRAPNLYLFEGISPHIFRSQYPDTLLQEVKSKSIRNFDLIQIVSPVSYLIRKYNRGFTKTVLAKYAVFSDSAIVKDNMLDYDVDSIFSVDGRLHYDVRENQAVFIYYYKNMFSVLDTNLNVIDKGHTIDTISKPRIQVGEIASEKQVTLSTPKRITNKCSYVADNILYVNSTLLSENEDQKEFNRNSVIDVYHLSGCTYQYSFYIPKYHRKELREFAVYKNIFYAIYEDAIISYSIPAPLFN